MDPMSLLGLAGGSSASSWMSKMFGLMDQSVEDQYKIAQKTAETSTKMAAIQAFMDNAKKIRA